MKARFRTGRPILVLLLFAMVMAVPTQLWAQQIEPTPDEEQVPPAEPAGLVAIDYSAVATFALYQVNQPSNAIELLVSILSYIQGIRGGEYLAVELRPGPFAGVGLELGVLGMTLEQTTDGLTESVIAFDLPLRFRVATEMGPLLLRAFAGANVTGYYLQSSGSLPFTILAEAGLRVGLGPVVAEYSRLYGRDEDRGTTFGDHNRVGLGISLSL